MARRGRPPHPDILTPREWEVLELLRQRLSNEEISDRLGISLDGAKYHVSEILGKLGVRNRREAALWTSEQRPWWQSAGVLLSIPRPRIGWLSPAVGAALAVVVAVAAVGLLVWALLATRGDESVSGPGPASPLTAELVLDRPSPVFGAIDFVSDDEGWMLVAGGLLRTTDGGESWTEAARVTGADIDFADEDHGWIVGRSGSIYATTDGESWIEQDSGTDVNLSGVYAASDQEAWAVGTGDASSDSSFPMPTVLLHTIDGGSAWRTTSLPPWTQFTEVTFVGADGWAAGRICALADRPQLGETNCRDVLRPVIFRTTDGGASWTLLEPADMDALTNLVFLSGEAGWAGAAANCGPLHGPCDSGPAKTTDGGLTWELMPIPDIGSVYALDFSDAETGWVLGQPRCQDANCPIHLFGTTDGGKSWQQQPDIPLASPVAHFQARGHELFVTGDGVALRSGDSGATFEPMRHPALTLALLDFADADTGYAVEGLDLIRTDDGGSNWHRVGPLRSAPVALEFISPDRGFVAYQDFGDGFPVELAATDDGGRTWEVVLTVETESPSNTPQFSFLDERIGGFGFGFRLFFTEDGGATWAERSPNELVEAGYMWLRGMLNGDEAQLLPWEDQTLWTPFLRRLLDETKAAEATDLVILDPQTAWMSGVSCTETCTGRLQYTTDAGETWTSIATEAGSGRLIFADAEHGWLQPTVPGDGGLSTSIDGRTLLYKID